MPTSLQNAARRADLLAQAVQVACVLEVTAPKPGNVTPAHDFADTTYADMVRAGLALGLVLGRAGERRVGELILEGVRASARAAAANSSRAANTNLGIVLLLTPLAGTREHRPEREPRPDHVGVRRVGEVVRRRDVPRLRRGHLQNTGDLDRLGEQIRLPRNVL